MIEAMACGTPVLALSGGAVEEVVCNGFQGTCASQWNENGTARVYTGRHVHSTTVAAQYCQHIFFGGKNGGRLCSSVSGIVAEDGVWENSHPHCRS